MPALGPLSHELIELPSGVRLEVSLFTPKTSAEGPSKLAICLHPWSWLGGRMDDPVLHVLKNPLLSQGYHVIRYNSRGVGQSSGWPSLTGVQEGKDLEEFVHWALASIPNTKSLVIIGYSHGSLITTLFPMPGSADVRISHILLSYPLGPRSWLTAFRGAHYTSALQRLLQDPRARVLVIYGDRDDFTSVDSYDTWADGLRREVEGTNKAELQIVKVDGSNHFWTDILARQKMITTIQEWAAS